jgi:hypothetical protein
LKGNSKVTALSYCVDDESWRILEKDVQSLLQRGLTDRTKMIRVLWRSTPSEWKIVEVCSVSMSIIDHFPAFQSSDKHNFVGFLRIWQQSASRWYDG